MASFGVFRSFFANQWTTRIASVSVRWKIRHVSLFSPSLTRSSWTREPMLGMGRECGIPSFSPRWTRRRSTPASILASSPTGGVCNVPGIQRSGLSGAHSLRS